MSPPFRLTSPHIESELCKVRELIEKETNVYFINFSGPELAEFHIPEFLSVLENVGLVATVIEPYVQPICFFTTELADLDAICRGCSRVTTAKLFGRVCAVGETPTICSTTCSIVESEFPESKDNVRFRLETNYIGETGVSTIQKIAVLSEIEEKAGFYAPKADISHPNFIFSMVYDFISEPTRFVLAVGIPVQETKRDRLKYYWLNERPYIGPTSMDCELASIMVAIAEIKPGDFVYDCFCGTASILVAAAAEGAVCFGSDIDFAVLRGKKMKAPILNFRKYNETVPDFCNCDCFSTPFKDASFDALICDPPYSIRASCAAEEMEALYLQLMAAAAAVLRKGGRLVFWMPVLNTFNRSRQIFYFGTKCTFVQRFCMFEGLNSKYGRMLLRFEKNTDDRSCECSFRGTSGLNELRQQLGLGRRKEDII